VVHCRYSPFAVNMFLACSGLLSPSVRDFQSVFGRPLLSILGLSLTLLCARSSPPPVLSSRVHLSVLFRLPSIVNKPGPHLILLLPFQSLPSPSYFVAPRAKAPSVSCKSLSLFFYKICDRPVPVPVFFSPRTPLRVRGLFFSGPFASLLLNLWMHSLRLATTLLHLP